MNDERSNEATPLLDSDTRQSDVEKLSARQLTHLITPIFVVLFLSACNFSMMSTVQGYIANEFQAWSQTTMLISSYMLPVSCTTPVAGRLTSTFGPKSIILVSGILSSLGAIVSGVAPSLAIFLLGRFIAGIAGGLILPATLVLVLTSAPLKLRGLILGIQNCGYTTGVALGGVIGGLFVEHWSWRPAFYLQAPCISLASFYLYSTLPAEPEDTDSIKNKLRHLDYLGLFTLTVSLSLFLTSLSTQELHIGMMALCIVTFVLFTLIEANFATNPIVPVHLLKYRPLLCACFSTVFLMAARWAILFYTPIYSIAVFGFSPAQAGASLIFPTLGFGSASLLVGYFGVRRAGSFYYQTLASFVVFATAYFILWALPHTAPKQIYAFVIFLNGLGTGAILNFSLPHLIHSLDNEYHAISTSLVACFRGVAGLIGAAAGGSLVNARLSHTLWLGFQLHGHISSTDAELIQKLQSRPALVWQMAGWRKEVAIEAYSQSINHLLLFGIGLGLIAMLLQAGTWQTRT